MSALTPLLAPDAADNANSEHGRTDTRSNMFVMAALSFDGGSTPVRIRNMSRGGALIESPVIAPEGSRVRLIRGSLSAHGQIAWQRECRAGIRFDAAIAVADWLPRGSKPTAQQRIDGMIHECRTKVPDDRESLPAASPAEAYKQLLDLRDALNLVAGELASDPAIAIGHPTALQTIDVTAQMLEKLAAKLAGGN